MDEQIRAPEVQQQSYDDVSWMLDIVWKTAVAMARLEKRLPEAEIFVEAFEPKDMLPPPLPLSPTHFQHVPAAHPAMRL